MFLSTLVSTCCLLTSPIITNPSLEIIQQHHLETPAGRTAFLADQLAPYATAADQLNREVQALALQIETLSPENDQAQIIALTEEMNHKMNKLLSMLPVLNTALSVDEDFQQIDTILQQTDPLSPEQQQVIDRITCLSTSVLTF